MQHLIPHRIPWPPTKRNAMLTVLSCPFSNKLLLLLLFFSKELKLYKSNPSDHGHKLNTLPSSAATASRWVLPSQEELALMVFILVIAEKWMRLT